MPVPGPPRLPPLTDKEMSPPVREILKQWNFNLHRTLAHNPETMQAWFGFGAHILNNNTLPVRDREIAILRVAWNCKADYEWSLHARLALSIGMTEDELLAICHGADDPAWSPLETALIRATDEMQSQWDITDGTWSALREAYDNKQLMDLVFVVGNFILVALVLKSFRIQMEPGVTGLPEL